MAAHHQHDCEEVRSALARLAAGCGPSERPMGFAGHVRTCAACRDFADRLARVRRWLEQAAEVPGRPQPGSDSAPGDTPDDTPSHWTARARGALARELSARLARDLLRLADGKAAREPAQRLRDVERVRHLLGADALAAEPWPSVLPVLSGSGPMEGPPNSGRARLLTLATCLDPQGLDLALQHLGLLVRHGLGDSADEEADRLLELVR